MRLLDKLVDWWMRRCPHDGHHVAADILNGGNPDIQVKYCRRCGAVRIDCMTADDIGFWDRPRPLWYPPGQPNREPADEGFVDP